MPHLEKNNPRREPMQERSKRRVSSILDVTAQLVQEVGVDGITTSEVARRAGIKLASLYRYFPNKNAIIRSLAERHFQNLRPYLEQFLEDFDLEEGLDAMIDAYAQFYRSEPGYIELWSGIQANPELNQLDMEDLKQNVVMIVSRAKHLFPDLSEDELAALAMVTTRSAGAVLRLAMTVDEHQATVMVSELKIMVKSYLHQRTILAGQAKSHA
ncbi:TetR/AcrR family transcriptional regulator [Acanthopleuribacter pedis]|uniref:TetR family transcriptional regulator n=1 Tax=Acanthopleuribacter pedis TaxID=442870 RepID=A0A8J7PZZ2_9BACT|nr:TetR/AcrR family transcriptional regulator [Acanthopleuribacter pedis]MBO1317857.1 TetR family transcriptional regulator [Acanthopleuribacter pedis]